MTEAGENINCLSSFLARRDVADITIDSLHEPVDVLVLLGSSLIGPAQLAARVLKQELATRVLISGGIGHSTQYLRDAVAAHPKYYDVETQGRAEAAILRDVMVGHLGVASDRIIIEDESTNCGTNAEASRRILDTLDLSPESMLLVQDPTMQRRSHACFERAWQDWEVNILSYAPFMPVVTESQPGAFEVTGDTEKIWPFKRFISLMLGEIPRLRDDEHGYGPKGRNYFDHVDIPDDVLLAHDQLTHAFREMVRDIPA